VETVRTQSARRIERATEARARAEAERVTANDLEIARRIQARLIPRDAPRLSTIDCAGACLEAGPVGGDYYDFFALGDGRIGLALADASGKGVSAALLMTHLQANLRSQIASGERSASSLLRDANRLFCEATVPERFATLFFARYDERSRTLSWVNCGHNPPLLLRRDGRVERLGPTAMVLGVIEDWDCVERETPIRPGDVLAIFSDGLTEAPGIDDEEFGEERLVASIAGRVGEPAARIVEGTLDDLKAFTRGRQGDDLTLVVVRAL
jgi:serine phosphatase RsbU (regulator of sigma subunit)